MAASTPFVLLLPLLLLCSFGSALAGGAEHRLQQRLLEDYSPLERPVLVPRDTVNISLGLVLRQLVDVDERNHIISLDTWLEFNWTDVNMRWNPLDYGGLTETRFTPNLIWRPDVYIYNSADSQELPPSSPMVVVSSDGSVVWIPPVAIRTSCQMDMTWFPYDSQFCFIKLGSWTYDISSMDIMPKNIDESIYVESGEWELIGRKVVREVITYDCCSTPYVRAIFSIHLRRRTRYYTYNIVFPSVLVTVLTIFGFCLPPDAAIKVQLEITILLATCFFLRTVAEMTPPNSQTTPIIVIFFTSCIVVVTASVIFSVLVLNINNRTHRMSRTTRFFLLDQLPRFLGMSQLPSAITLTADREKIPLIEKPATVRNNNCKSRHSRESSSTNGSAPETLETSYVEDRLLRVLERIVGHLEMSSRRLAQEDEVEEIRAEWVLASRVVDRLCLVLFVISLALIFLIVLSLTIHNIHYPVDPPNKYNSSDNNSTSETDSLLMHLA